MKRFDFGKIPEYIRKGSSYEKDYSGSTYYGPELNEVIELKSYLPNSDLPWVATTPVEINCETVNDNDVMFTKYRWERNDETLEYWVAIDMKSFYGDDEDEEIDMFFAYQNQNSYMIISCIASRPDICTPDFCWGPDNDMVVLKLKFNTVDELVDKIYHMGAGFMKEQILISSQMV